MHKLTTSQAKALKRRWAAINAAEIAELRATPATRKFRQLVALMSSARTFGWSEPLPTEASTIRARWQQLRRTLRG